MKHLGNMTRIIAVYDGDNLIFKGKQSEVCEKFDCNYTTLQHRIRCKTLVKNKYLFVRTDEEWTPPKKEKPKKEIEDKNFYITINLNEYGNCYVRNNPNTYKELEGIDYNYRKLKGGGYIVEKRCKSI